MGKYYDQAMLRGDHFFGEILESVMVDVAREILAEDPATPYHEARELMAREILETSSERRAAFKARIRLEAVMHDPIREAAVVNGKVTAERIDDAILHDGLATLWSDVTLAVWPDILSAAS